MLLVSICVSALLVVVVNAIAFRRTNLRFGAAILLSFAAVVPLFCANLLASAISAVLVGFTGMVCWAFGTRARWFVMSSLGVTALVYCVPVVVVVGEIQEWDRLKANYPMESLAPRLAYEDRAGRDTGSAPSQSERVSSLESRLRREGGAGAVFRERSLEQMHQGYVKQFIDGPNFGFVRLPRPAQRYVEWTDPRDNSRARGRIPQPSRPIFSPAPEPGAVRIGYDTGLDDAHETNVLNFLSLVDLGYARDREHVVGFRPHRFREPAGAPQRWKVERLELVSLLKYDEPAVYVSENLPAMDELRDATTRPLDPFETEALAALRRGEDLMVQDRPDHMRVLGSLRAVRQCVNCHRAERGELLGAFSYKLALDSVKD